MIQVHEGASAPLLETLQQMPQANANREATLKRAET